MNAGAQALADYRRLLAIPYPTRVAAGAVFLDAHELAGWESRIDLARLDMASGRWCLGGQLHPDEIAPSRGYTQAWRELPAHDPDALGFNIRWGSSYDFGRLTACWVNYIEARLALAAGEGR